ncbi:MAG TPA: hypothetical protein VLX28_03310 [Thermoanaerobaculia bacterium]|nr:hypothetical protein [Thermoanaerobaculia bacterium]
MPNLIRLGLVPFPLQVDEILDARLCEDMVATPTTLLKAQVGEKLSEVIEADVGI